VGLRLFNIDIFNLSNQSHEFDFDFDNNFFEEFDNSLVEKGSGKVHVILSKSETMINMEVDINGKIELVCDRSLEKFDYPIQSKHELILKFGDEWQELSEQITIIPRDSERINVAQFIYEYIGLSVPMKKLHPKFQGEGQGDEPELIYSSLENDKENKSGTIDPRWSKLKDLKK
jgi:uncharacterized metal-binding protein YceD (DUF177 family)